MSATQRRLLVAAATAATAGVGTAAAWREADARRAPLSDSCRAPALSDAALASLRTSGVVVVDGVVEPRLVRAVRATAVYQSMPTRVTRPRLGQRLGQRPSRLASSHREPPNEWPASATGRYHRREETFSESDLRVFERVEARVWPLVAAFFEGEEGGVGAVFRSELQVV
jgi:hypothetical protein